MRRLVPFAAAAVLAALLTPGGAGALLGTPEPPDVPGAPEADTLIAIGEHADGGALVEVVDLDTGVRRVVEDTRGMDDPHGHGGEIGTTAFDPADRCTNDGEYTYTSVDGAALYWHTLEDWNFHPDNVPSTVPNWKSHVQAAHDIWQDTDNPCGLPDTIGWVSPSNWTNDAANLPKERCRDNPSDGKNTVGFREHDHDQYVAYACLETVEFDGVRWFTEGDVSFNTLHDFCEGCSEPGPDGYNIRAAALHEIGHILGLGHSCNSGTDPCDQPGEEAAVMVPFITNANTILSKADVQGATSLYPAEEGFEIASVELVNEVAEVDKLTPGHEYTVHVDLKNIGMRPWSVDDAAYVLSTLDEAASTFEGSDWVSSSRPSRVDEDRTDGPDDDDRTIVRDEVARFSFETHMPLGEEGQTPSLDDLGILHDDATPSFFTGPAVSHTFDIGTFAAVLDQQATTPVVQGVEVNETLIDLENTGDVAWFVGETLTVVPSDGAGTAHCSPWVASGWPSCHTASFLDENAGRPLAPGAPVLPGEAGRFWFTLFSPVDVNLIGPQSETFEAKLDGGRFVGAPAVFDFVVL